MRQPHPETAKPRHAGIAFDDLQIRRTDWPTPATPAWQVYEGQFTVNTNSPGVASLQARDSHFLTLAVREGFWEDDCAIEATTTSGFGGVAFRVQDKNNYYFVMPFSLNNYVYLVKVVQGHYEVAAYAPVQDPLVDWGVAQTWRIRADGANLDVRLNVNNGGTWEPRFDLVSGYENNRGHVCAWPRSIRN